jgi:hypothetical protein
MSNHDEFLRFCGEKMEAGQTRLADTLRAVLAREVPELFALVSDADDHFFLEPLLFAWFRVREARASVLLPQLLVGGLPADARPECVEARSDASGWVHLPGIGGFQCDRPGGELLVWLDGEPALTSPDREPVDAVFLPQLIVPGTGIESLRRQHALLAPLCEDEDHQPAAFELGEQPTAHLAHLARAFELLGAKDPAYHALVLRATRLLVVFSQPRVPSFAAIGAHGAAFLSACPDADEVFFIDDLIHQCGHVVFNGMTACRSDFLRVDPDRRMDAITRGPTDGRSLYGAFHGLFGEYFMCRVLDACDRAGVFHGRAAHELYGRLAFIGRKYLQDAHNLDHDLYTDEGRFCFEILRQAALRLRDERPDLWSLRLDDQPYVFDYGRFASRNPLAGARALHA